MTPVWFVVDGDDVVLMTHESSLKAKSLQRDPRVMISVDDEAFPYGFVLVEGVAKVERPAVPIFCPGPAALRSATCRPTTSSPRQSEMLWKANCLSGLPWRR